MTAESIVHQHSCNKSKRRVLFGSEEDGATSHTSEHCINNFKPYRSAPTSLKKACWEELVMVVASRIKTEHPEELLLFRIQPLMMQLRGSDAFGL